MGRFVEIPADTFLGALNEVGKKIEKAGGKFSQGRIGREVTFDFFHHSGSPGIVRVYTSLTEGADRLRECDSDAIRVVIGFDGKKGFVPLSKGKKILRTARQNLAPEQRPLACINRVVETLRDAYKHITRIPLCPQCNAPMVLREPKKNGKQFKPFFGCSKYPDCKGSKSA